MKKGRLHLFIKKTIQNFTQKFAKIFIYYLGSINKKKNNKNTDSYHIKIIHDMHTTAFLKSSYFSLKNTKIFVVENTNNNSFSFALNTLLLVNIHTK